MRLSLSFIHFINESSIQYENTFSTTQLSSTKDGYEVGGLVVPKDLIIHSILVFNHAYLKVLEIHHLLSLPKKRVLKKN